MIRDPNAFQQFSYNVLQEMGLTPGDIGEFMIAMRRNSGIMSGFAQSGTKLGQTVEHDGEEKNAADSRDRQQDEDRRADDQRRDQERRFQEQRDLQRRQDDERRQEERQAEARRAAENRPAEDRRNMEIGMLPLQFAGFGMMMGFAPQALGAVGNMLSPQLSGLGSNMMVAGNAGGGLLTQALGALGLKSGLNVAVTGPNQTMALGLNPLNPNAPGANPLLDPLMRQRQQMQNLPGMNGPGMSYEA